MVSMRTSTGGRPIDESGILSQLSSSLSERSQETGRVLYVQRSVVRDFLSIQLSL